MTTAHSPEQTFPVGRFATVRDGLRLHYHEFGERTPDQPSLLFLHGSGPGASGYSNFRHNWPAMVAAGHHALVVDYLGYGHSDKPSDFRYTNVNQVALLHDFLVELGIKQVVPVGNSLGGFLGLQYALTHPDRVPRLICMAPGGIEDVADWIHESPGLQAMGAAVRRPEAFTRESFRELLTLIVKDPVHLTDQVIDERLPIARTQPTAVYSTMEYTPIWHDLGAIRVPVLGFWGYHDRFLPVRHALVMQEKIPDCRMILSNRAGHWFMIEEPALFNDACIQFLSEA